MRDQPLSPRPYPPSETLISIRLPKALLKRVDALVKTLARNPAFSAMTRVTRSGILKAALVEGLPIVERRAHGDRP